MGAKNPRRQAAAFRRGIEGQRSLLRFVALFWILPLGLGVLSFALDWHWLIRTFAVLGFLSGIIQHSAEVSRRNDYRRKLESIEKSLDADS